MRGFLIVAALGTALSGCGGAPAPVEPVAAYVPPPLLDCSPEAVDAIAAKYLNEGLKYPPHSMHRRAFSDALDATFEQMLIGRSPMGRRLCENNEYYAVSMFLLKAEGG